MPTRNVVLTQQQQQLIESLVNSGRYQNASEVLREGLRLIAQREITDAAKLEVLRRAAHQGWGDIAGGHSLDVADDELEDYVHQLGVEAAKRVAAKG